MPKDSVLIIEDDILVGGHLRMSLEGLGCRVVCVTGDYTQALEAAAASRPDLALVNINVGGIGAGITPAGRLRREFGVGLVLLLSQVDDDLIRQVAALEPLGLLMKPFQHNEMIATVRAAMAKAGAEARAAAHERRQAAVLDAISDGYWDYDVKGNKFVLSHKWVARTGWDPSLVQCEADGFRSLVHPDDLDTLLEVRRKLDEGCADVDVTVRFKHADGSWHCYSGRGQAVEFDASGTAARAVGMVQDITEDLSNKNIVEHALADPKRAGERQYEQIVNGIGQGVLIIQDGRICFGNPAAAEMTGKSAEDLAGNGFLDVVSPQDRHLAAELQAAADKADCREFRLAGPVLDEMWVRCRMAESQWNGRPAILACLTDITDTVRARTALERFTETLQTLIDASPLAVVVLDDQGRVIHWGGAAEKMFCWSAQEIMGCPSPLIQDEGASEIGRFVQRVKQGSHEEAGLQLETVRTRKDGGEINVNLYMVPIVHRDGCARGMLCLYEDITQRKHQQQRMSLMEARLAKMRRLEAISAMAGGVAHEFNNILAAITGYNELALEDIDGGDEQSGRQYLKRSIIAAARGRELVRRLAPFSRHAKGERAPVDMAVVLPDMVRQIRSVLPQEIELDMKIGHEQAVVPVDSVQLQRVFLNLCQNSTDALAGEPGIINVSTSLVDISGRELVEMPGLDAGRYFRLCFSDNGPGMDDESVQRAFEPFFRSRNNTAKTGLGLAEVHGIITGHQGWVEITSDRQTGTDVVILLPLAQGEPVAASTVKADAAADVARILFVDDEESLVEVFKRTLGRMGHSVKAFSDSRLALEAFKSEPESFDLVITDHTMPHITGLELARFVRETRADVPVIICTGYSEQLTPETKATAGVEQVLLKPVDRRTIAQAIDRALSSGGSEVLI